ncbi:MFS transporter [Sphingoaurantiacus capsulatus]|uniref:MFS transporter n=1 Tax=Sphingoaurantiacus capsulatus TaxID=1771310 RepID=A0ABV7X5C5_9SPHN
MATAWKLLREGRAARPTLLLLTGAYGLQYLDRMLVGLFAPSIKADLALSDTQIGLITGVAFSLFYVVASLPLARLADRWDRKTIVVASLAAMSVATAVFGAMGTLAGLFVARACVAIGEAGATPTSVSLLAGLYDSRQRQIAMSLYSGGGFAGMAVALSALALLSDMFGWRQIFQLAGVVGLVFAILLAWRLPATPRVTPAAAGFARVQWRLLRIPSFTLLSLGLSAALLGSAAGTNWVASFLSRSYGMAQGEILLFLAAAWGGGALLGTVVFGSANARLRGRGARGPLAMLALAVLGFASAYVVAFTARTPGASLAGIAVALFCIGGLRGPTFALVQDIVPDAHQAAGNALLLVMTFLIGSMLGPLLTGVISDALTPRLGPEALRAALFGVLTTGGGASLLLLAAAGWFVERDIAGKGADTPSPWRGEGDSRQRAG